MQTFSQFKAKMRLTLWPAGEAKNLRPAHDRFFALAMSAIQQMVPCVQQFNTSQFEFCATFWEDAKTVVPMPLGYIRDVYTIANDEWRDQVHYESENWTAMQAWATRLYACATPINEGLPKLPMGYRNAESATDLPFGRARLGIWTYNRHRLFVAPWIQSNETLVVEWDGIKTEWSDTDGVNSDYWTVDHEDCIQLFVKWKHECFYGDPKLGEYYKNEFDGSLADLMWDCREMIKQQPKKNLYTTSPLRSEQLNDDVPPVAPAPLPLAALIGDWGLDGPPLQDNLTQINLKNPQIVIPLGDNIYGNYPNPTVDSIWGKFWSARIHPYTGAYQGGTEHTIWPVWGNHDWDYNVQKQIEFLPALKNNKRYYTIVKGPVEFFMVSSDPREPDLNYQNSSATTESSIEGQWLKLKLALSTAKWKVVVQHHPPYNSDVLNTPGAAWMRWPLETWGAHMLLCGHGHGYEDGLVGSLPWIVNGLGGHSIRPFNGQVPSSLFQYNGNYGFGLLTADCNFLTHQFFSRKGTLIRTVQIGQGPPIFNTGGGDNGGDDGGGGNGGGGGFDPSMVFLYGHGSPEGVVIGWFIGQPYVDLDSAASYKFLGVVGQNTGWV